MSGEMSPSRTCPLTMKGRAYVMASDRIDTPFVREGVRLWEKASKTRCGLVFDCMVVAVPID